MAQVKSFVLLLMLLNAFIIDAESVRRLRAHHHPASEPWLYPCGCGTESDAPGRILESIRFNLSDWQRMFANLELMAESLVEIAEDTVTNYVSFLVIFYRAKILFVCLSIILSEVNYAIRMYLIQM